MITPIRAKFIEHMEFLGLSKHTQRSYINGVKGLGVGFDDLDVVPLVGWNSTELLAEDGSQLSVALDG